MIRRDVTAGLVVTGLWPWCAAQAAGLSESDAASGVRAALQRGAEAAVGLLGRPDGFLGNPLVRIALPGALKGAAKLLRALRQGKQVDELVTAMNRAAESAVPETRTLLINTVEAISVEDALKFVRGGNTAVTDFFAGKTRVALADKFLPIVTGTTDKLALAERYNKIAAKVEVMGLVKGDEAHVEQYVTARTLDGLYRTIAEEETKLRADPVATGSVILKKVFGR